MGQHASTHERTLHVPDMITNYYSCMSFDGHRGYCVLDVSAANVVYVVNNMSGVRQRSMCKKIFLGQM